MSASRCMRSLWKPKCHGWSRSSVVSALWSRDDWHCHMCGQHASQAGRASMCTQPPVNQIALMFSAVSLRQHWLAVVSWRTTAPSNYRLVPADLFVRHYNGIKWIRLAPTLEWAWPWRSGLGTGSVRVDLMYKLTTGSDDRSCCISPTITSCHLSSCTDQELAYVSVSALPPGLPIN